MTESLTQKIDKIYDMLINQATQLAKLEQLISKEDINIIPLKKVLETIDKKEKEIETLKEHRCITIKDLEEKFGKTSKTATSTTTKVIRVRQ